MLPQSEELRIPSTAPIRVLLAKKDHYLTHKRANAKLRRTKNPMPIHEFVRITRSVLFSQDFGKNPMAYGGPIPLEPPGSPGGCLCYIVSFLIFVWLVVALFQWLSL